MEKENITTEVQKRIELKVYILKFESDEKILETYKVKMYNREANINNNSRYWPFLIEFLESSKT